jgi:GTP-binding protein
VILVADRSLTTLLEYRHKRRHKARNGQPGGSKDCTGADGADAELRVPVGTQVYDADTGELLGDLAEDAARVVIAKGGRGGRGNANFATSTNRTPEHAQPGEKGVELDLKLELKLIADVGLLGFPNAGKSTLVSRISRARPRVADYPFTTLTPNLGVVRVDTDRSYVVADLPGLIEGAAEGAGLGHQFLRHLERTRLFLHLVTIDLDPDRDPVGDYRALRGELERFEPTLLERPSVVVVSQVDRTDVRERVEAIRDELEVEAGPILAISAVTGEGVDALLNRVSAELLRLGLWGGTSDD